MNTGRAPASLRSAAVVLLFTAASAWGQAAPAGGAAVPAQQPTTAREDLDALVQPPEPSPAMRCYRAAQQAVMQRPADAYVCDLAVQMARDGVAPAALATALGNRALVLAADGRLEPALADLQAALEQTPDDPALYANLGNLLLRMARPADALAAHDRAVDLAPGDPAGYYNRAFSYRALGDARRAEQDVAAARSLATGRDSMLTAPGNVEPAADRSR